MESLTQELARCQQELRDERRETGRLRGVIEGLREAKAVDKP